MRETGQHWRSGFGIRRRYADVALHLIATGVVAAIWLYTGNPVLTLYVGGCVVASAYVAMMLFEMKRTPVLISPLSFYFLWYSIGVGLAALSIAGRVAAGQSIRLSGFEVRPSDLAFGYVLFLIGSASFHLGVQLTRPLDSRSPKLATSANGSRAYPRLLVCIWVLGVVTRLFGSDTTPAGAVFGILAWASNASLCAYCLSTSPDKPGVSWMLVTLGCLVELGFNLHSLSKAYIMYSLVPILWTCVYLRAYRKWLFPIGAALAAFYLGIVAPVVTNARSEGRLAETESPVDRLLRNYAQYTIADTDVRAQMDAFFERQFDPILGGFIHGEVEKYGLLYGDGLDYLAYAFIPRLFWPDKPGVTRGTWFTVYLGAASKEEDATSSTALSATGELYWNFGLWGVVSGMLLLGILIGVLWRISGSTPYVDPLRMLLYFTTMILVVDNAQAGVMAVGISHRLLVLGTIIGFWGLMRKRRSAQLRRERPYSRDLSQLAAERARAGMTA